MGLAGDSFETDAHHGCLRGGGGDGLFRFGRQRPAETNGQKLQSQPFLGWDVYQGGTAEYDSARLEGGERRR